MAEYNSVPLGQAGTGSAFVLGESRAANQFVADQAKAQQMAYQAQLAKQQQAQKDAALYQKNLLKLKGGTLWQDDINRLAQQDLNEGTKLMSQGINPSSINWNDPKSVELGQAFNLKRQDILAKNDQRLGLQAHAQKTIDQIAKNPELYEPEDVKAFNEWTGGTLENAINTPPPVVRTKFDPNKELVPLYDPITFQTSKVIGNTKVQENKVLDEPTRENIETLIGQNQRANRWIERQTGLTPTIAKTIITDLPKEQKRLMDEYKGNPKKREELAKAYGITGTSAELDALINQQAQENVQKKLAYNSLIDQQLNLAKAKANEFVKTNPDYTLENQNDKRVARNQRNIRFNERGNTTADDDVLYRQQLIEDMLGGVEGSGEKLNAIVKATSGYNNKGLNYSFKGDILDINVPERVIETEDADGKVKEKIIPPRTIRIDKSNPVASRTALNTALNEITSEKINESKYQTGEASGKIKNSTVTKKVGGEKSKSMVTMVMPNGSTGQVPSDKVGAFLKKYPKAKKK